MFSCINENNILLCKTSVTIEFPKKIKMLVTVVEVHHKFLKQRWCCWNCLSTFPSAIGKGLKTDEE